MQPAACISFRFWSGRADRCRAPAHPFAWKMLRMNTSMCGAASTTTFANALPVTAYARSASAMVKLSIRTALATTLSVRRLEPKVDDEAS